MSLKHKWLLTVGVLVIAGVVLEAIVGMQLALFSARRGAYEWLHAQYRSSLVGLDGSFLEKLEREAAFLASREEIAAALRAGDPAQVTSVLGKGWHWKRADELWIARTGSGELVSDFAPCARHPPRLEAEAKGARVRVLCGDVPVMLAGAPADLEGPGHAALFLGTRLDLSYLDFVEVAVGAHAMLVGPSGILASTIRDVDGARVAPELLPASFDGIQRGALWFERTPIRVSPSYGGYRLGTEPLLVGVDELDVYLLAAPLERNGTGDRTMLVLLVPAYIMDAGAWYASLGMGAVGLLIVALLVGVAWRLVLSFTRPLFVLAHATRSVASGDLSVRVAVDGNDELAQLAASFNAMVAQLSESKDRAVQSEKMAAIGQLAGGVAHEINNPLGVILGFAQGMEKRVPEGDPLRLPVSSITREALRCKALVQELLVFARTAKKATEPLDLNELVRATAILLDSRARMKAIALVQELTAGVPVVHGNRTQLQQVLVNLGTNALDATPEGGTVTVRTYPIDATHVGLEVSDTGTGIPRDVRPRIFDPFFTTKEPGKGTGLGLSLVYEIVQQHGGDIAVADRDGGGTIMRVRLRAEVPPPAGGTS